MTYPDLLQGLCCALAALEDPGCRALLGPLVPGATMTHGARVPGTSYELDPAMAAFNLGVMLGWPQGANGAQSLAAILPVADYLARRAHNAAHAPLCIGAVLGAMRESAGALPRAATLATAAALTRLLGGGPAQLAALQAIAADARSPAANSARSAGDAAARASGAHRREPDRA